MEDGDLLKGTKCEFCSFRLTRIIEPFEVDLDEFIDMGFTEEELDTLTLEQNVCSYISADIDGRVLECNRFKDERLSLLIKTSI